MRKVKSHPGDVGSDTSGRASGRRTPWLLDDVTRQRLRNLGYGKHEQVPGAVLEQLAARAGEGTSSAPESTGDEDAYRRAWRGFAEAALDHTGLSTAVEELHDCADAPASLATAFELAGRFLLEAMPPLNVWDEEDSSREQAEKFAGLAGLDGGDEYDVEMNLYLPLVAAARAGVGLGRVLELGARRDIVENRLLLIVRYYLSERAVEGWSREALLDLVEMTAVASLRRNC
jgi:hypothetical protein